VPCACHITFILYLALTRVECPILDVVLYQVLWLANNSVKKLSVNLLLFYLKRRYKKHSVVSAFINMCCAKCVFLLYGLCVCFKTFCKLTLIKHGAAFGCIGVKRKLINQLVNYLKVKTTHNLFEPCFRLLKNLGLFKKRCVFVLCNL